MKCAHPISEMGSVMGKLYCCYEAHYEMGVAHTVGPELRRYVLMDMFSMSKYQKLVSL